MTAVELQPLCFPVTPLLHNNKLPCPTVKRLTECTGTSLHPCPIAGAKPMLPVAPATGVPRARAPASALRTHPRDAVAISEQVAEPQGAPACTWATRSPAVLMSQDGTLGSGLAQCGLVR